MYHSASGVQSPHCIHVVGVGRVGAAYVDAMLRNGDVEDMLADSRARFTALVVDIGEQDMLQAKDYAKGFLERLDERGIPSDRAQIRTVALDVPSRDDLFGSMRRHREFLKLEYPRYYWNPNYEPWLPGDVKLPEAGEHCPRAVAKAIYAKAYYDGDRPLERELEDFVKSVDQTRLPSMVLVCFSLGGGTGSGMVVDLVRHLSNVKLGRRVPVIGVGVMPTSSDDETYRGASLFPTLNEIDCMLDSDKNQGVVAVWGDLYQNPFTGGFFVVSVEQTFQRTGQYTKTGVPAVRQNMRLRVANKFVADAFMRFAVADQGRTLFKALRPAGLTGAPHETVSSKSRSWAHWNAAKMTHPGVQVLPGERHSKWANVVSSWIDHIDEWSGLRNDFETDYTEAHVYAPRDLWDAKLETKFRDQLTKRLVSPEDATMDVLHYEFFDVLTAYAAIITPGVARTDLTAFWDSRDKYDTLSWEERLLHHSWLMDLGVMLSEPAIRFDGMAGECLWGCACWVVVPYAQIRGDVLPPSSRVEILENGIAAMTKTVVPTP